MNMKIAVKYLKQYTFIKYALLSYCVIYLNVAFHEKLLE